MRHNALIYLAGSLVVSNFAFSQENSKIGLDVLASTGYSHFNGLKHKTTNKDFNYNGFNINASALYSVLKTNLGSPVVGLGINYFQMNSNTISQSENNVVTPFGKADTINYDYKEEFKSLAIMGNVGFKFDKIAPKFTLLTLANFGYSVYDNLKTTHTVTAKANGNSVNISLNDTDTKIKNHFIYGVSLVGTYEIVDNFSLGLGATLNRHEVKRNEGSNVSYNIGFNEFSANLVASYSL